MERSAAEVDRLVTKFDELGIGATEQREPTEQDGAAANEAITAYNRVSDELELLDAYVYATVSTDSRDAQAQGLMSQI